MNITNYFAVEPLIVEHLKATMTNIESVNTPFNIDDMINNSNSDRTISVIYYGDRMGESSGKGKMVNQYQQWLIVLTVRDAGAQSGYTNSIREYANPFILELLEAMQGYDPDIKAYRQFKRTDSPVTAGSDAGFAYFPFMFETQMFI